jgi:hypothetical protein
VGDWDTAVLHPYLSRICPLKFFLESAVREQFTPGTQKMCISSQNPVSEFVVAGQTCRDGR